MPNASRYLEAGYTYHLTHRCHDRRFLLKFARDRDVYRRWLREGARRYNVPIYNFCITSNHVHVIVHVDDPEAVAAMMQLAAATFARQWNRRKGHEGSVWEHPYKCTIIQGGSHLLNCLRYVSLNMVRAGVVVHPQAWRWCGHDELTGVRKRYTMIAMDRLLNSLELNVKSEFLALYEEGLQALIERGQLSREALWTESLAVGDRTFVERVTKGMNNRHKFEYGSAVNDSSTSFVREVVEDYSAVWRAKRASKA